MRGSNPRGPRLTSNSKSVVTDATVARQNAVFAYTGLGSIPRLAKIDTRRGSRLGDPQSTDWG